MMTMHGYSNIPTNYRCWWSLAGGWLNRSISLSNYVIEIMKCVAVRPLLFLLVSGHADDLRPLCRTFSRCRASCRWLGCRYAYYSNGTKHERVVQNCTWQRYTSSSQLPPVCLLGLNSKTKPENKNAWESVKFFRTPQSKHDQATMSIPYLSSAPLVSRLNLGRRRNAIKMECLEKHNNSSFRLLPGDLFGT